MTSPIKTSWIPVGDAGATGYLALPPAGSGPGIVLWQEIFGVNEHIRAVAEQYALAGFVVLAPDAFWRGAPRIELGYTPEDIPKGITLMSAIKPEEMVADVRAAVATLRAQGAVAGRKVGTVGYCFGGRLAYLSAAHTDVDAAVPYYGGGIHNQLELAANIRCPVQFHYAEIDANIPLDAVENVRQAMVGKNAQVHIYKGAHHGFNCWQRGSYQPASAALALGRSLGFLAEQLF
jgi:carboxymethylenebutenolidase